MAVLAFFAARSGTGRACLRALRQLLNNADFAHVTRDNAADARCFRYRTGFFRFVIANFQGVITKRIA
jgi:hypothetical protein